MPSYGKYKGAVEGIIRRHNIKIKDSLQKGHRNNDI